MAATAFEHHEVFSLGLTDDDGDSHMKVIGQARLVLKPRTFLFESIINVLGHVADAIRVWSKVRQHEKQATRSAA